MQDEAKQSNSKLPYHGPDVVDVGTLAALTTGVTNPSKDGPGDPEGSMYHSSNALVEVDLGDHS